MLLGGGLLTGGFPEGEAVGDGIGIENVFVWHVPAASGNGALVVPSLYTHCSPLEQVTPAIPPQTVAAAGLLSGALGEIDC